jgi:processing peptidase subunit beta
LPNGIRVASEERDGETATVGVWTDTGSRYEDEKTNGVAHFLEHMCFKGTPNRSQQQLEVEIENLGAHLNAYTSRESTIFYTKVFKKDVKQGVDILSDILRNSTISHDAVEREKETIIRESHEVDKQMEEVIFDRLHETAYRGTALSRPILGSEENIMSMTKEMLENYRSRMFTANRMVIAGAGAIKHEDLVKYAEDFFGGVPQPSHKVTMEPARFLGSDIRVRYDDMPLAHVAFGFPVNGWKDPDNFVLMVCQALLGSWDKDRVSGGEHHSSPLVAAMAREELGKSIMTFNSMYSDTGLFGVYAVAPPTRLQSTMWWITEEMRRLSYDVTEERLFEAKKQLIVSLLGSLDGSTSACEDVGRQMLSYGRRMHPLEALQRVEAVDVAAVHRVAKRFFWDKDFALAAVGPTWELPDYNWLRRRTYAARF